MIKKLLLPILLVGALGASAQTADDIINRYLENTGGADNWKALQGVKMIASINQGGMEIPIEQYQMRDGRQGIKITFQGKEIKQGMFDGKELWSHNFMTMKAEKSDAESTENFKLTAGEFPDPFLRYKENGYKVELLGKETVEGSECFKIKLTKKPVTVDGKKEESVAYYYFDTNDYVPIVMEQEIKSGQGKGMVSQIKMSDYTEVNGLMFPFSVSQGVKGGGGQGFRVKAIELNPKVDTSFFNFPSEK